MMSSKPSTPITPLRSSKPGGTFGSFYRYSTTGIDGRIEAGTGGQKSLAAGSYHCDIGLPRNTNRRVADRERVFAQAVHGAQNHRHASRAGPGSPAMRRISGT